MVSLIPDNPDWEQSLLDRLAKLADARAIGEAVVEELTLTQPTAPGGVVRISYQDKPREPLRIVEASSDSVVISSEQRIDPTKVQEAVGKHFEKV